MSASARREERQKTPTRRLWVGRCGCAVAAETANYRPSKVEIIRSRTDETRGGLHLLTIFIRIRSKLIEAQSIRVSPLRLDSGWQAYICVHDRIGANALVRSGLLIHWSRVRRSTLVAKRRRTSGQPPSLLYGGSHMSRGLCLDPVSSVRGSPGHVSATAMCCMRFMDAAMADGSLIMFTSQQVLKRSVISGRP